MASRRSKADGEEKAKPLTTASTRVTRSMDRQTRSTTQQNGAKAAGSFTKVASPNKVKRKKSEVETERAKKAKKEVEKDEEDGEAEVEDREKPKIVIEHW